MAEAMLAVTDLVAGYDGLPVVRGISLDVARGEVVAILGANGVGKTTLNRCLSGLIAPSAGVIRFLGKRIDRLSAPAILERGLVHVPEGRRIFPNLTVAENLLLGAYARARRRQRENLARVYDIFPRLAERRRQAAGTLSGGEQQMLAIGRGLMGEPELLILDEPSLGLSPLLVEQLFALIRGIVADGLTVLLVEQNVVQSLELADRAYVLESGQFSLSGKASDLAANPELKRAYLGM